MNYDTKRYVIISYLFQVAGRTRGSLSTEALVSVLEDKNGILRLGTNLVVQMIQVDNNWKVD